MDIALSRWMVCSSQFVNVLTPGQVQRAAQDRQSRQDHQRHGDHLRAFLGMFAAASCRGSPKNTIQI